jgi:hypothetical protein
VDEVCLEKHFLLQKEISFLDTVPNPCLAASTEPEQYYPFAFSAQAFVQCNGELLYVRPCAGGLYWNQELKICDRAETSPAPPAKDQSYQVTYGTEQQPAYNRPTASFPDKTLVQPQTYQPQVTVNDQSSSSYGSSVNKFVVPKQNPIFHSFQTLSRHLKQQPTIQKNNYETAQEQPMVISKSSWTSPLTQSATVDTNQQYGQSWNQPIPSSFIPQQAQPSFMPQQTQSSFMPQQQIRAFTRVFQPESSRNWNTQSTSSGYRR